MSETKMGETKESATDPLGAKRQPSRPSPPEEPTQFVVTMGATKGDVLKVEKIEKSGQRRELSDEEFAALAGEDEMEDLGAALEEAYGAGINDAIHDALGEEEDEDEEGEEEIALRRFILGRSAGRQLLRRGVRRLILRRVLQRELSQRRPRAERNATRKKRKD